VSVTADAYQGFVAAAGLTVQHLHAVLGLDLWMVTCVAALPPPELLQPLLAELGGVAPADETDPAWAEDRQVVVAAAGPLATQIPVGTSLVWATSFCRRMVAGHGPSVAPDVSLVPAYAELEEATSAYGLGTVRSYAGMPLRWADGRIFGTVCGYGLSVADPLEESALAQLGYAAEMLSTVLATHERGYWRSKEVEAARALAETDPLTGLANRRGWRNALTREQERLGRYGHAASVLVVDLDDLKTINDTDGHARGDAELVALANVLRQVCRPADVLARTGGDEFAVLAVEAGVAAGGALATRLRLQLQRRGVRASVGVSSRRTGEDLMVTADRADAAMNVAKRRRHRTR
jgi:diguanylate cyclase